MSGVHVDDVAGLIRWALETNSVQARSTPSLPEPFRNAGFTREVARAVHRPAILPAPGLRAAIYARRDVPSPAR